MKNQTDLDSLSDMSLYELNNLGTGIFLIPNVESSIYADAKKVFVPDITYGDCVRRGEFAMAFKWVPHSEATFLELSTARCTCRPCISSCVEKSCICNERTGRCQ